MKIKLKPVADQVIVITGASSGIGLATARMAVKRGARVVVAARQQEALLRLEDELNAMGRSAVAVPADVTKSDDVHRIAEKAIQAFGGFDTWVNNAGASVYGLLREVPIEEEQAVFDVNFWGTVRGMKEALAHLRKKGGAIVNIGSDVSDHAIPLQGAYAASKHAVKGYTDAFRLEVEKEKFPVSFTLVKPAGIATPFFEHAANHMATEPIAPAVMYSPEVVAEAILYASENPVREFLVGETGVLNSLVGRFTPSLSDKVMKANGFTGQQTSRLPKLGAHQTLQHASGTLQERGDYDGTVMEAGLYNKLVMAPRLAMAGVAFAGLAAMAAFRRKN
jgi:short-subunit dehydrogenase